MNKTANTILITGACGEIGHGLIEKLSLSNDRIITLDLDPLEKDLQKKIYKHYTGNILDKDLIFDIFNTHKPNIIFHLAAILSTSAEKDPLAAHQVNVNGTLNILHTAGVLSEKNQKSVKFIFPSSIAVYGMPNLKSKKGAAKVGENEFLNPITAYGIHKLYCENIGIYFSCYFKSKNTINSQYLDFRCLRFPGIISADTTPTGGTSDYAPEMLHFAAKDKKYSCFVRPDTKIPFMAMPDAVNALVQLTYAAKKNISSQIYNVSGFSACAKDIEIIIRSSFPNAKISYKVDTMRQNIVDSWPADINDSKARKDWGWSPEYNFKSCFRNYLMPKISSKYN